MRHFLWLFMIPVLANAQKQSDSSDQRILKLGIQWTENLNWQQIKEKAKKENRFIFLDFFATWCGPCKLMDRQVYSKSRVGDFINDKYISVKVQIDDTKNDNRHVKIWKQDAINMAKKYRIISFPTYLFFAPDGRILYKDKGYKIADQFIDIAKIATIPGMKYVDPYKEFDDFVSEYKIGHKNYLIMPKMIKKASEINEKELMIELSKEYFGYLERLKKSAWITKDNIAFISENIRDSKSPFFDIFYSDSTRIDSIMSKVGFSSNIISNVIHSETALPFLHNFYKGKTGEMILSLASEPNWDSLGKIITTKYNGGYSDRSVRKAKSEYYRYTNKKYAYIKTFISQMERNELDLADNRTFINECAWYLFEESTNKEDIYSAISWMEQLVNNIYAKKPLYGPLDTYAQLLYKASMLFGDSRFEEAITWEQKALLAAIDRELDYAIKNANVAIEKMKKRVPTWK